jgi:hypothetical protein
MSPITEPSESSSGLDDKFFGNWNRLKRREDEWYLGYGLAAAIALLGLYFTLFTHYPGGWADFVIAGLLALWWRGYLAWMRHRHRKLWNRRHPQEPSSS